jgi:hypothetical protein
METEQEWKVYSQMEYTHFPNAFFANLQISFTFLFCYYWNTTHLPLSLPVLPFRMLGGLPRLSFRGSHYFLESLYIPGRWLAQRWRPVTSGNWTPNIYIPSGGRVAQLYPQALGAHFSRLLRHAWATLGLFFTPGHHTGVKHNTTIEISFHNIKATDYGLDDRSSRVWFPAADGNFSLHHNVQNGSRAHPDSYPMGTGGSFPGDKATGAWSWPLTSM